MIAAAVSVALPAAVRLGPGVGEDAALVEIGGELWAVAADPVTFTAHDAGRLAVTVNANDLAVRGAEPRFVVATVLVGPQDAEAARVQALLAEIADACRDLGAALIGGHTEVTPGIENSILALTMLGPVIDRPLTTGGARSGDLVGLVRQAGLEGTAILVAEHRDALATLYGAEWVAAFEETRGGGGDELSVVRPALAAARIAGTTALHDVTEGGVGEALWELSRACGHALEIVRERIPVLPATATLCRDLGIDPLGLIGSGGLLVTCDPEDADELRNAVEATGVPLAWIGRVSDRDGPTTGVPRFERDELLVPHALARIRAVVFDMDGTLVDSRYDWPAIRSRLGVEGASIIDELNGLGEPDRSHKWNELEEIERRASDEAGLHSGAHELLELLRDRGVVTALVTNNTAANTQALLDRHDLHFDLVMTRDDGIWKPSGAPLVEAVRRLAVDPESTLAVGDSRYDLEAGRAAGCGVVCLVHEGHVRYADEADLAFSDLDGLRRTLEIVLSGGTSRACGSAS